MEKIIMSATHLFANGVRVVNTTPHALNFIEENGDVVTISSSVKEGEKDGPLVVNARAVEEPAGKYLVKTRFVPEDSGTQILDMIEAAFPEEHEAGTLMAVGSIIAVNAYPGRVVGMVPAPGFERVPPAQKRMSCSKFNVA